MTYEEALDRLQSEISDENRRYAYFTSIGDDHNRYACKRARKAYEEALEILGSIGTDHVPYSSFVEKRVQ